MEHPDLEKKLAELRQKKQDMVREFTRKTVDAINLSEQATMTHMSLSESNCPALRKTKRIKSAKEEQPVKTASSDDQAA